MSSSTPVSAAAFLSALGVNIHLGQKGYRPQTVIADMAYLGLTAVREASIGPKTSKGELANLALLANAGLTFDFYARSAVAPTIGLIDSFLAAHPGSVAAIEGPNEVNNFPLNYHHKTGTAAAVAYQSDLYQAVKADPLLAAIPVLNFTDYPDAAGAADGASAHPYPKGGAQPLAALTAAVAQLQAVMPGQPVYFTEAGYFSLPGVFGWEGVDAVTQAKLDLNLVMDASRLGVTATYLYDLVDDGPDPGGTVGADHFGLFTFDGAPKPAAVAIHNLTAILGGAKAAPFTPTALDFTLAGLPPSGSSLVVEASPGVYDVVVWAEPDIWDAASHTPIAAPPTSVTLTLGSATARLSVFDPLASADPLSTSADASSVTIAVTDHPVIIQVSSLVAAMASIGPSASLTPSARPATPAIAGLTTPHA